MPAYYRLSLFAVIIALLLGAGCTPTTVPAPGVIPETPAPPAATPVPGLDTPTPTTAAVSVPYELVSSESLFAYLKDLTAIQPYSGWRNSGSSGEAEALDYVVSKLGKFSNLQSSGLELERQDVEVYLSTEIWSSGLTLTINSQSIAVPAEGLRGSRFDRQMAVYFDSDGVLNDSNPNPVTATGTPLVVNDPEALDALAASDLKGQVLFLDYSLIDSYVNNDALTNGGLVMNLLDSGLAGMVVVTQYSNRDGESRGTGLGDGAIFQRAVPAKRVPILYVRIEDLSPAGIKTWQDLQHIEAAALTLDADVFSPGKSGNLIARIPGADSSQAVILGAHIDSPNGPGAFDDGSGSAALLEVARVLDAARIQPPVDVYLAWFGGHEIGIYGSAHFAATHQALLDRTLALYQMDGLGLPLENNNSQVTMNITSYGRLGDERLPLPDFLSETVAKRGLSLDLVVEYGLIADNSNFDVFNVPNVYLGYMNGQDLQTEGSSYIHFSNHWHDPYETVELGREVEQAYVEMTQVMLAAALETGRARPNLRVPPAPDRRALFVSSHNQSDTVVTTMLRELGMALAWEGFKVDLIPYGQAITPADLENTGIVVLPPTLDYPGQKKEKWSDAELALLKEYVAGGGLLVVTNSVYNYAMKRELDKENENARALNALLEPMGVAFIYGASLSGDIALAAAEHPLTADASYLAFYSGNGVPFKMTGGVELVRAALRPIVGLVNYGQKGGQVLVVADIGILQCDSNGAKNMEFVKNIAHYARTR